MKPIPGCGENKGLRFHGFEEPWGDLTECPRAFRVSLRSMRHDWHAPMREKSHEFICDCFSLECVQVLRWDSKGDSGMRRLKRTDPAGIRTVLLKAHVLSDKVLAGPGNPRRWDLARGSRLLKNVLVGFVFPRLLPGSHLPASWLPLCEEPSLPHTSAAVTFCPSLWGQATMNWTSGVMHQSVSLVLSFVWARYFVAVLRNLANINMNVYL